MPGQNYFQAHLLDQDTIPRSLEFFSRGRPPILDFWGASPEKIWSPRVNAPEAAYPGPSCRMVAAALTLELVERAPWQRGFTGAGWSLGPALLSEERDLEQ